VLPDPKQKVVRAPQTPVNGEISTGLTGQIETGGSEATAADSATEIALNLLQSVLDLF
jgi:hypothetical protein